MEHKFCMSYFNPPITNKVPSRTVTLLAAAKTISSSLLKEPTLTLRSITDKGEARRFKGQKLPYVTPAGVFSYCNDQSLIEPSLLLCIDLDHLRDVSRMKRLLTADSHFLTLMVFRSPSGDGLKWFLLIDLSMSDYRTWYHAVRNYLLATYASELSPRQVDAQCQNLSRACFLCYDPEVYVADADVPATKRLSFDPVEWAARTPTAESKRNPLIAKAPTATALPHSPAEELAKAKAVAYALMRRGASIAEEYGDYVRLGFSLANGLGTEGGRLYHLLCSQSSKYNEADCEAKWRECLAKSDGRTTIATFYHMAREAGVDPRDYYTKY